MTKCVYDVTGDYDEVLELLRVGMAPSTRVLMSVAAILQEACDVVREAAVAKGIRVVVVGVPDEVLVKRAAVLLIVAALLRKAITAAGARGRVAVTGQEMEGDLVFAVYDDGRGSSMSTQLDDLAAEATRALGGRVWAAHPPDGHLMLLSVPLYRDAN